MPNTGLIIISNIKNACNNLKAIERLINVLYIHLTIPPSTPTPPLPTWGRLITQLYLDVKRQTKDTLDLRVIVGSLRSKTSDADYFPTLPMNPIDMIFMDSKKNMDICRRIQNALKIPTYKVMLIEEGPTINDIMESYQLSQEPPIPDKTYKTVVLGGTFDRIHLGHKIFLTQAVLRATERVVVGVTTNEMLGSKVLPELILPIDERVKELHSFLCDIDPSLQYEIVPISDAYGPTKDDPNMDMIVVSKETYNGALKVNELRASKGLNQLDICCIDLIEIDHRFGHIERKVSSSNHRIDLLGTRLKKPVPRPNLKKKPYVIGITGGIASGKSTLCKNLKGLGSCEVLDCDKIGHELYEPNQPCYDAVVSCFGKEILDENQKINRSKLGAIVFSDPEKLNALNQIVWPQILIELKKRIAEIPPTTFLVFVEAAVLIKAGWENEFHEIWSVIVPEEEAVRRLMQRNNLNKEEALKRVASQTSNAELVDKATVVICPLWDPKFTEFQYTKAWSLLTVDMTVGRVPC